MVARTQQGGALRMIAETLNRSLDLQEALHNALGQIIDILELQAGWVFLKKSVDEPYYLAAHHALPTPIAAGKPCWDGRCQCQAMARNGQLEKASNMVRCTRIEMLEEDIGIQYHASIPLETASGHIGILNIASRSGDVFPEDDLELLNAVGNQMAVAIERASLYDRLRCNRLREHRALAEISNVILSDGSFDHVLSEITRVARDIFSADTCLLLLAECRCDGPLQNARLAYHGFMEGHRPDLMDVLESQANLKICSLSDGGPLLIEPDSQTGVLSARKLFTNELHELDATLDDLKEGHVVSGHRSDPAVYAMPISGLQNKEMLGMLYIGHHRQGRDDEDIHLLTMLANQAALAVEQARSHAIRMQQMTLQHELDMARDIQNGFLPDEPPALPGYDVAVRYDSAQQVSGDFYDFMPVCRDKTGFVIADVAGKGVPAALVMALSRTLLRATMDEGGSPLATVLKTNSVLVRDNRSDRFVTLFYGVLDANQHTFDYVRAGHNPPMVWRAAKREIEFLRGTGLVMGVLDEPPMAEMHTTIEANDVLVLYTDGVTEAMNGKHQEFGEERLMAVLRENEGASAADMVTEITAAVEAWRGSTPPSDDFTLVVLRRLDEKAMSSEQ